LPDDNFSHSLALIEKGSQLDDSPDPGTRCRSFRSATRTCFPSTSVLAILSQLESVIEMGAGTGYWAYKLRLTGVSVIAFDKVPPDGDRANRYHAKTGTWTNVLRGDQTVLPDYPDRALFFCWPPLFSSLGDCPSYYRGDTVAYIGDDGYRTAKLDHLQETLTQVTVAAVRALQPYPGVPATLTIWKRTR
jgi:hypothetical protein